MTVCVCVCDAWPFPHPPIQPGLRGTHSSKFQAVFSPSPPSSCLDPHLLRRQSDHPQSQRAPVILSRHLGEEEKKKSIFSNVKWINSQGARCEARNLPSGSW